MTNHPAKSCNIDPILRGAGALALALCLTVGAHAQEQQDPQQGPPPPPPQSQGSQSQRTYAPQDADKPPYSHDRPRENASDRQEQREQPAERAPQSQPLPASLTIPAGTVLVTRINEFLSTDHSKIGDQFTATLENPIVVNGWVVARRGQTIVGKVKEVRKAGRIKGTSELGVELTDLSIVDGRQLPILTELWKGSGGTSHGQDAATVATTTGLGALIGAAADWGTGAAIGAGAGAAAGIGAVLLTRGRPTVIEPESQLSFRLVDPVTVDTTQSQQAFLPVGQRDFDGGRLERRGPRGVAVAYPGPYPCGYYGPCYPYYGYPTYVGIYGGPGYYHRGFHRY